MANESSDLNGMNNSVLSTLTKNADKGDNDTKNGIAIHSLTVNGNV